MTRLDTFLAEADKCFDKYGLLDQIFGRAGFNIHLKQERSIDICDGNKIITRSAYEERAYWDGFEGMETSLLKYAWTHHRKEAIEGLKAQLEDEEEEIRLASSASRR